MCLYPPYITLMAVVDRFAWCLRMWRAMGVRGAASTSTLAGPAVTGRGAQVGWMESFALVAKQPPPAPLMSLLVTRPLLPPYRARSMLWPHQLMASKVHGLRPVFQWMVSRVRRVWLRTLRRIKAVQSGASKKTEPRGEEWRTPHQRWGKQPTPSGFEVAFLHRKKGVFSKPFFLIPFNCPMTTKTFAFSFSFSFW